MDAEQIEHLRMFFADEGDLAAGCWNRDSSIMRGAVEEHRINLLELTVTELAALSPRQTDAIVGAYDAKVAAARESKRATVSRAMLLRSCTRDRLTAWRNRTGIGTADDDRWFTPRRDVIELSLRVETGIEGALEEAEVETLFREVGRLSGPLTHGIPDGADLYEGCLDVLTSLAEEVFRSRPAFDAKTLDPIPYWNLQRRDTALRVAEHMHTNASRAFVRAHPEGPLPVDADRLQSEVAARRAERARIHERARAAINEVIGPISAALRKLADERAAQARALDDARGAGAIRENPKVLPAPPHPGALPFGASPRGAELWVCDLLRHLGMPGAEVTPLTGDGGVDVRSESHVVSVKHYVGSVPIEEVREIFAVATVERKSAALWTSGTITTKGLEFANRAPVAIVRYDIEQGTHQAVNESGRRLLLGLNSR